MSSVPESLLEGWRPGPRERGTMDIIWSCVSTVFLCLWSMLHLNVPAESDTFKTTFWRKARWLLLGILAPEVPMMFACGQWSSAKRSVKEMRDLGAESHQWTLSHAFLADMGGILLHLPNDEPFPITAKQIAWMVQNGHVGIPDITAREIRDKSKADICTKVLAVAQTAWFTAQIIARSAEGLAITPIELASVALALTALATLRFWHAKPLDVQQPFIIRLHTTSFRPISNNEGTRTKASFTVVEAEHAFLDLESISASSSFPVQLPLDEIEPNAYISRKWSLNALRLMFWLGLQRPRMDRIPNDRDPQILGFRQHLTLGLATATFATLHFVDWHYAFPTDLELALWRVGCCIMWLLLAVYGSAEVYICWREGFAKLGMETGGGYKMRFPDCLWFFVPAGLYFVVRMLITVQVFISLRRMPPEAFQQVEWTLLFPHV